MPGLLSGQPDQGLLRQQHRRRDARNGERYADSENAFAYRKALRADCTCNGRDAAGLAPVDLTLDTSLRAGDVIATTDGLVAYSGIKVGNNQSPEFTPVASYPGLTAEVRTRLGEMKVAPVAADAIGNEAQWYEQRRDGVHHTHAETSLAGQARGIELTASAVIPGRTLAANPESRCLVR